MKKDRRLDLVLMACLLRLYPRRFRREFGDEMIGIHAGRSATWRSALATLFNLLVELLPTWLDARRRSRGSHAGRERGRESREELPMKTLFYEARLSARTLFLRQRSVTALATLTLALGLGATIAIFSVIHGVLLAPLPYGEPERIVEIYQVPRDYGWGGFAGPNFTDLRERLESVEVMAAYDDYRAEGVDLTAMEPAERVRSLRVGAGYFEVLGVAPFLGRTFSRDEEIPADAATRDTKRFAMITAPAQPVVILSHGLWQRRFGAQRSVLGRSVELDGQAYEVVAVMPPGLGGHAGGEVDLWLPLDLAPGGLNVRGNSYLSVIARLRPGIGLAQLDAELGAATARLKEEFPAENEEMSLNALAFTDVVVGPSRVLLTVLFGAVAALLAMACINVASLLLVRGLGLRGEMGLRAALGAGRRRLFAQSLMESLWIGLVGGAAGLGLAALAVRWLLATRPAALPRYDAIGLHLPVLFFSLGAMLLTVLLCGLLPALRAAQAGSRLGSGLRSASRGTAGERRLRDAGVCLQVALALILLCVSGLLVRTFNSLHGKDMGFEAASALTFKLRLPDYAYGDPDQRIAFYEELFPRLEALPGIVRSGATSKLPGDGHRNHWGFRIEGRGEDDRPGAEMRCVVGKSSEALGIALLAGRRLSPELDRPGTEPTVTVNRTLVEEHFQNHGEALGARVRVGGVSRTIVGILGDALQAPQEEAVPKIYIPQPHFASDRNWDLSFVVTRREGSTTPWVSLEDQVQEVVRGLDPRLVVYELQPMTELLAEPIARQRFGAQLMMVFAAVSLWLAIIGLFGSLAHSLSQRRGEIGIRMALGADGRRVLRSVLKDGLGLVAIGILFGLGGVWLLGRWLESLLFGVQPGDPAALLTALGVLTLAATLATWIPARRASKLDPAEILRSS